MSSFDDSRRFGNVRCHPLCVCERRENEGVVGRVPSATTAARQALTRRQRGERGADTHRDTHTWITRYVCRACTGDRSRDEDEDDGDDDDDW